MMRKRSLYALVAALTLAWSPSGLSAKPEVQAPAAGAPPCGSCVTLGLPAERVPDGSAGTVPVAIVEPPDRMGSVPARAWAAGRAAIVDLRGAGRGLDHLDLAARQALTHARARRPGLTVGVLATSATLDALLARGLAAYLDVVVVEAIDAAMRARWLRDHPGLAVWRTARLDSFAALLDESVRAGGDRLLVWPTPAATPELLEDLARLADFFPQSLVELPAAAACDPAAACALRTFERPDTRERIHWISRTRSAPPGAPVRVSIVIAAARAELAAVSTSVRAAPGVADSVLPLAPQVADATGRLRLFLPFTGVSSLIVRVPPVEPPVAEDVQVVGARDLTVEEIVARHQAQAARQEALVRTLVTFGETALTFEVPAFPAPVVVRADTVVLEGNGPTEVIQRNLTVNGVAFGVNGVPRLPIVEPERVATPPLAIALSREYLYRKEGRARVRGRWTYVVAFEPAGRGSSLFEGRAWIDAATFALVRVDAAQTALRGPVTASRQLDEFEAVAVGSELVWLLSRSETRQLYQGAGVTTPIVRVMRVTGREINPPDLERRRRAAYQSPDLMLRDTPGGWRYLERGDAQAGDWRTTRSVAGRGTKIATLAAGVIVDPNITRPLPFAGVNYTDFDVAGAGAQLNVFFGGTYGQAAFHAPSLGGSRWQAVASAYLMLARYHDRAFRDGRERYEENLEQRPVHARAGLVRAVTPEVNVRAEYVFDLTSFDRADSTAAAFVTPASQVVHAARLSVEAQRRGWRLEAWWNPARRTGWREWGIPGSGEYGPAQASFQRAGASGSRSWSPAARLLMRMEAAAMAGADLDRFSQYAFGTFDNRLRGYPSASIRYDRGAVARAAVVWQPGGRVRLDGFADAAVVREPGFGAVYRGYPGVGAAVETAGPFSLLLGVEWGYGIKGLNTDGSRGTQVVRVTAYKVF